MVSIPYRLVSTLLIAGGMRSIKGILDMTDVLFSTATYIAMLLWLLLAFLPRWRVTKLLVQGALVPAVFGLVYCWYFVLGNMVGASSEVDSSLSMMQAVAQSFQIEQVLLAGWLHFLVFDLFVGAWIVRDAHSRQITHWYLLPCLFFTFFAGPTGLMLYLLLRLAFRKGGWFFEQR